MTDAPPISEDAPNEILAIAKDAKEQAIAAAEAVAKRSRDWPIARISLGVGIGSAAVAAAVMFATRDRDEK
jgi:ribonuclease HII